MGRGRAGYKLADYRRLLACILLVVFMVAFFVSAGACDWATGIVDSTPGLWFPNSTGNIHIDSDSEGYPHVVYIDAALWDLKYAYADSEGWSISTVDTSLAEYSAGACSMKLDSQGRPHVAYLRPEGVIYSFEDEFGWHGEVVDVGSHTVALDLDSDDRPHICYKNGGVKYAFKGPAGWQFEMAHATSGNVERLVSRRRSD